MDMNKTALHDRHRTLGAKMTDFHGWEMPLYYTSILEEHTAVRQAVGLFDISHMGQLLVSGRGALPTLNDVMVSDISQVGEGRACYTLMLNEQGGIVDDLIMYRIGNSDYLVIVNCGNRTTDVDWLLAHRQGETVITDISQGRSILAVQGPLAARLLEQILDAKVTGLGRFETAPIRTMGPDACIARTGYTGSDGFELFVPDQHARRLWDTILSVGRSLGTQPIGLGARDTLRIEAGLRLYGTDMDIRTTPFEAGLDWTVAINKPSFFGKNVLVRQRQEGLSRKLVGFELVQGPVPRTGMELMAGHADGGAQSGLPAAPSGSASSVAQAGARRVGTVTSGTFSPILNRPIGMGYVEPSCTKPGTEVMVSVRSQRYKGTVVKLPFWKGEAKQAMLTSTVPPTLERLR